MTLLDLDNPTNLGFFTGEFYADIPIDAFVQVTGQFSAPISMDWQVTLTGSGLDAAIPARIDLSGFTQEHDYTTPEYTVRKIGIEVFNVSGSDITIPVGGSLTLLVSDPGNSSITIPAGFVWKTDEPISISTEEVSV